MTSVHGPSTTLDFNSTQNRSVVCTNCHITYGMPEPPPIPLDMDAPINNTSAPVITTTTTTTTSLAWSYTDLTSWDKAVGLDVSSCSAFNKSQSPIDILSTHAVYNNSLGPLRLSEAAVCKLAYFETSARNWEVKFADGKSCYDELGITWNGKQYNLRSFTFHSPSEHTVDGTHYDMEAQFRHEDIDGNVLMVAEFMRVGKKNPFMEHITRLFPKDIGESYVESKKSLAPYKVLFPSELNYWAYTGSLTSPPCSMDVQWIVLKNDVQISARQLNAYRAALTALEDNGLKKISEPPFGTELGYNTDQGVNNRPVQKLMDRVVYEYPEPGFKPNVQTEVMYDVNQRKVPSTFWSTTAFSVSTALCGLAIFGAAALGMKRHFRPLRNGYGRMSSIVSGGTAVEISVFVNRDEYDRVNTNRVSVPE
eukprot:gnl/MRDRNA2_/MRDRNA2_106556_c0_seq1.p1 gnl/MRDRNA2_/MRDRNA2_106556_c0~~gnl/MRDRNA2_/MRDRNA2_106556_c0_seq1.p1  ORF type:complete len:439 (-),score=69.52 gnl/MRDRNA2_/MRDRNA2_106556_c0_seq1:7-1272(-)